MIKYFYSIIPMNHPFPPRSKFPGSNHVGPRGGPLRTMPKATKVSEGGTGRHKKSGVPRFWLQTWRINKPGEPRNAAAAESAEFNKEHGGLF